MSKAPAIRPLVERLNDRFRLGLRKHGRRLLEQLLLSCDQYGVVTGISQIQFARRLDCGKRSIEYAFEDLRRANVIAESARDPRTGTMAHALSEWVGEFISNG